MYSKGLSISVGVEIRRGEGGVEWGCGPLWSSEGWGWANQTSPVHLSTHPQQATIKVPNPYTDSNTFVKICVFNFKNERTKKKCTSKTKLWQQMSLYYFVTTS